jgi:hypothetical protein
MQNRTRAFSQRVDIDTDHTPCLPESQEGVLFNRIFREHFMLSEQFEANLCGKQTAYIRVINGV